MAKPDFEKIVPALMKSEAPLNKYLAALVAAMEDAYRAGMFDGKQEQREEFAAHTCHCCGMEQLKGDE